jgi:hypothetical protein
MYALTCMIISLLYRHHQHVSATCSHPQGGKNKNTATIIMCWNQSTDKPPGNTAEYPEEAWW